MSTTQACHNNCDLLPSWNKWYYLHEQITLIQNNHDYMQPAVITFAQSKESQLYWNIQGQNGIGTN